MFSVYLLRIHNTVKQEAGGVTVLFQGKVVILSQIKLGVNENPPFYQCSGVNARANDARNTRSRVAQCKYVLLRFIAFHAFLSRNFERKWKNISFQNLQEIKFVAHVIY